MACPLATERVWVEKAKYHDAEKDYFEHLSKLLKGNTTKESGNDESNSVSEYVTPKAKKTKKIKNIAHPHEAATTAVLPTHSIVEEKRNSDASMSFDSKLNDVAKKENSRNEEAKAKKKKKKKNNKEVSEKSQERNKSETQEQNKEDPLKRQKSYSKLKAPGSNQCALVSEIAKARQHIKNSLERMDGIAALAASPITAGSDVLERVAALEKENAGLRELVESLKKCCLDTNKRVQTLESRLQSLTVSTQSQSVSKVSPPAKKDEKPKNDDDDDDGVDLFASESEDDEEANAIREERLAAYHAKKSKKPALIAKSSVVLDVKPWDDDTDMKKMEEEIRKITTDGLLWGASKLQPVAFGIQKLVLSCVVEDEKVSIDWLTEEIENLSDYVQSVDVAAFNKI